ncbi:MAG TPA: lyase family protein, partial [Candidatus Angelobacter sp.]
MWSGRFRQPLDPHFEEWQRSFPFDQKLLHFELAASGAHAQALKAAGILTPAEFGLIVSALDEIGKSSEQQPGYFNDPDAEDVHHFVETKLVALVGEIGKKLHSGRSRNEQIATDLRLFVRESIDHVRSLLGDFLATLLDRADEARALSMPAYTHLQRAEPVLTAHWLLAYFEMFWRDGERLLDCRERVNECPLGS